MGGAPGTRLSLKQASPGKAPVDRGMLHIAIVRPGGCIGDECVAIRECGDRGTADSTLSSVSPVLNRLPCLVDWPEDSLPRLGFA